MRELLADADALPVDLSERVCVLRHELERAAKWVRTVRDLVPRGSQRTRGLGAGVAAKSTTLKDLSAVVKQVTSGQVAAAPEDVAEAVAVVDTADNWIARVRIALDRTKIKQLQQSKETPKATANDPIYAPATHSSSPAPAAADETAPSAPVPNGSAEMDDEDATTALSLQVCVLLICVVLLVYMIRSLVALSRASLHFCKRQRAFP